MENRRQFLKTALLSLLALPFVNPMNRVAQAKGEEPLPAGTNAVPETDAVASALGYKADASKVDFARYPQRKKPESKNQFCKNCALFTPANKSWGKCQMITSGLVNANGWCGSWSKKS